MSGKIRSAALVLVLAALFTSSAHALPPVHAAGSSRSEGFLTVAWNWFASFVLSTAPAGTPGLTALWEKAGSSMDPNGITDNFSPNGGPDLSSSMDPNGYK